MYRLLKVLFLGLCLLASLAHGQSGHDDKIPPFPVLMQIHVTEHQGERYLSLNYQNMPHWHTYWKNPGDAGLAFKNEFTQNGKSLELEGLEWPTPKTFIAEGDILGYGYEGGYSLFYKIPKNLSGEVEVSSNWLVCKHICIPGKANLKANLSPGQQGLVSEKKFDLDQAEILKRMALLPQERTEIDGFKIELVKGDEPKTLKLVYEYQNEGKLKENQNLLLPFLKSPFDFKRETLRSADGKVQGVFTVGWDGEYEEPVQELDAQGNLPQDYQLKFLLRNPANGETYRFERTFKTVHKAPTIALLNTTSSTGAITEIDNSMAAETSFSLLAILFFAFVGGLILNIMPCVLPVISIKLFGLLKHSRESKKQIFRHNIFYSLGVLSTFLLLAFTVLLLKATGEAVGWGFQLQSPTFVAIMVIVIFVMALNLFGVFEFATPGGKNLGGVTLKDSFIGDFLGGVLATILSTPCSAPFLGTALTVAFSGGPLLITSIFLMIGLGLAFPFLLTAFFPHLIRFLPRPGMWMDHVKKFLGLILVLTTLWLLDVFGALVDGSFPLLKLQTALVFIFFALYAYKKILKRKTTQTIFALIPLLLLFSLFTSPLTSSGSASGSDLLIDKKQSGLPWESWSEAKMVEYQKAGTRTFVDFTAKWCFTCKVNEKIVLDSGAFKELREKYDAKLLLADWTKKDPLITNFLEKNNLVGVPAYFVIDSQGVVHNLGETITVAKIEKAMQN